MDNTNTQELEYNYVVISTLTVSHKQGDTKSKVKSVEYNLVVAPEFNPPQLDVNAYFNEDGVPSKSGAETVTRVLLASLAGNVRYMHDNKMMSAEEHLIYIIKELKRHLKNIDGVEGIDKPLSIITTQTKG